MGKTTISYPCSEGLGVAGPGAGSCLTWAIVAQWYTEFWCTVRTCFSSLSGPTTQPTCSHKKRMKTVSLWVPAQAPLSLSVLVSLYFLDRTFMKHLWYFQTLRLKAECGCSVPGAAQWQRDREGTQRGATWDIHLPSSGTEGLPSTPNDHRAVPHPLQAGWQ